VAVAQVGEEIQYIETKDLVFDEANPRRDVGDISELAFSIKERGILEPIIVRPQDGHFAVVVGRRRWAAAKEAGKTAIPAIVRPMSDEEARAIALIENLHRKDLGPLEEAAGYRAWLKLTKKTQADLAREVAKAPSTIANALRLLDAPEPVKKALEKGDITAAHAKVALELKDPALAAKLSFKGEHVDDLKQRVDELNADYNSIGAGAIAAAKRFYADVLEKHPSTTIVWKKASRFDAGRVIDLVDALGECPTKWIGEIAHSDYMRAPTAAQHDKVCKCHAQQIVAERDYNERGRLKFKLERACIDEKQYRTAKPKKKRATSRSAKPAEPKPLTAQQQAKIEAQEHKRAEAEAKKKLVPRAPSALEAPLYKRLRKGTIPADLARALAYLFFASPDFRRSFMSANAEEMAWGLIATMPAKKVAELGVSGLAAALCDELLTVSQHNDDDPLIQVAEYFGVKLKVRQPKAKKKGKR